MAPNLIPTVYDALQLGHGRAGMLFDAGEAFLLADNYAPPDSNTDTPEVLPVFLHAGSGRRFTVTVHEIVSDTPGDPTLAKEAPSEEEPHELESTSVPVATVPVATVPAMFSQPQEGVEPVPPAEGEGTPNEAIQAPVHQPQPENPETNVPPDFFLKVQEKDAQIQPGVPLPPPSE